MKSSNYFEDVQARIFILAFCINASAESQNFIPNNSFENFSTCPTGGGQINLATPWYDPTGTTSDYLNSCNGGTVGVPDNVFGFENARSGVGYAGFYAYKFQFSNEREYLQIKLNDTLEWGKKYLVVFYTSLADTMNYSTNNIGAYFSASPVSITGPGQVLNYPAQIVNPTSNSLTGKTGWRLISDTLFATGGELYMTIGNFNVDSLTDTTYVGNGILNAAYYYIDDVSVIDIGWVGVNVNENSQNQISIFPSPAKDFISVSYKSHNVGEITMNVINALGEIVMSEKLSNKETQIQVSGLPAGVYYCKFVSAENQMLAAKKIIIIR